jgi:hypothetical protein
MVRLPEGDRKASSSRDGRSGGTPLHQIPGRRIIRCKGYDPDEAQDLTQGKGAVPAATLAIQLGTTEGAVHVAVHRLKKRYRAILQEQIAATLDDPSEVDDEVRSLFDAIRS